MRFNVKSQNGVRNNLYGYTLHIPTWQKCQEFQETGVRDYIIRRMRSATKRGLNTCIVYTYIVPTCILYSDHNKIDRLRLRNLVEDLITI